MDHFASTAGGFVGKDRDFKSAGGSTEASWLGAGATTVAPAAKAAPAKAATGGSMDHFASTAGGFVGKDRDWASAMGAAPAVKAAPAATAAPAKAATGGSMDHFASTASGFVGKDRDWASAMGATPAVKAS